MFLNKEEEPEDSKFHINIVIKISNQTIFQIKNKYA